MKKLSKILVVDDDLAILEIMKIILEEAGFSVRTISDTTSLKKIIKKDRPQLILLDIWISGVNGKDITIALKREKDTKNIPIILLSAHSDTRKIARESGADGFIEKPFDMDMMIKKVRSHL